MPHSADFTDAHHRHWEDAELLFDGRRWANADQLYGFSAECGLKAVMKCLGMTGNPDRQYRKHVHELWPEFKSFAQARNGARYVNLLPDGEPFADWSHDDRYVHRICIGETAVETHRQAASEVRGMVELATQDGQS